MSGFYFMQTEKKSTNIRIHRRLLTQQNPRIVINKNKFPKDFFEEKTETENFSKEKLETEKTITRPRLTNYTKKIKIKSPRRLSIIPEESDKEREESIISRKDGQRLIIENHEKFKKDLKDKISSNKNRALVKFENKYNPKSKQTERISLEPEKINFGKILNDSEISQSSEDPEDNKPKLSRRNFRVRTVN